MKNNCINLYRGQLCRLTAHEHDRKTFLYVCAYPHNCYDCEDYKPKEEKDNGSK